MRADLRLSATFTPRASRISKISTPKFSVDKNSNPSNYASATLQNNNYTTKPTKKWQNQKNQGSAERESQAHQLRAEIDKKRREAVCAQRATDFGLFAREDDEREESCSSRRIHCARRHCQGPAGEGFEGMANTHSPTRFNGEVDSFFDPNFTLDINKRMRVPKSIRVGGDFIEDDVPGTNGSAWNMMSEKLEMHVPDRILVVGQEQHMGTKAPPREITLENAVLPSEPPIVRCITPPRVLTLDTHYFPTADEDTRLNNSVDLEEAPIKSRDHYNNDTQVMTRNTREQTPAYGVLDTTLPPGEEVQHLRRQVGKLNRRIIAIESEIQQQQQRMKFIYVMTAMYLCFKTIFWFGKN